jgi:uracil phosphoribosyltransferase
MSVTVLEHPLAGHLLAELRDHRTPPNQYRQVAHSLTHLLVIEATRELRTRPERVRTPLQETDAVRLGQGLAVIPVLRAGLGMLDPVLALFPDVAVGYVGLERNEETAVARRYYVKFPKLDDRYTLVLDPMLATGGSAVQAIALAREMGAGPIVMVCVIAAPEGVRNMEKFHPDVRIVTAALDEGLNERKYIVPGLGDFGDRLYGTQP